MHCYEDNIEVPLKCSGAGVARAGFGRRALHAGQNFPFRLGSVDVHLMRMSADAREMNAVKL